jgi:tellurite resistance protein
MNETDSDNIRIKLVGMSKAQKFAYLDTLVLDNYIVALATGGISPIELAPIVTYLKNNKTVQDKKEEESEADVIEGLIDDL